MIPGWFPSTEPQPQGFGPCFLIGPIFAGCTLVSVTTIFLLSVERGIKVLKPLHRNLVVTRERTLWLIALFWLFCFLLPVSPLIISVWNTISAARCVTMPSRQEGGNIIKNIRLVQESELDLSSVCLSACSLSLSISPSLQDCNVCSHHQVVS